MKVFLVLINLFFSFQLYAILNEKAAVRECVESMTVLKSNRIPTDCPTTKKIERKKVKFFFLKQLHKPPFASKNEEKKLEEDVIKSQMCLLKYLREIKPDYLFEEQILEKFSKENMTKTGDYFETEKMLGELVREDFPNRIPSSITELSTIQRKDIYENGIAKMLFHTGEIEKLFAVYKDFKQYEEVMNNIKKVCELEGMNEKFWKCVDNDREQIALTQISDQIKKSKKTSFSVALIYGGAHDFKKYFENEEKRKAYFGDVDIEFKEFGCI